jgi:hypothetical protein
MAAAARRVPAEPPSPAAKVDRLKQRLRENVARNLLRLRSEKQMSQRQLSERADISQTYISQLETLAPRPARGAASKVTAGMSSEKVYRAKRSDI